MLFNLFVFFIVLGVILALMGFAIDVPIVIFIGSIMVFLLGISLLSNGLDIKNGEYESYQYGNNFTGYHWDYDTSDAPNFNPSSTDVFLFHKNTTDRYTHYDDASGDRFGYFLLCLGAFLFVLGLFRL